VDGRDKPGHDEHLRKRKPVPESLAPASGSGMTLEDRRTSLEVGSL
jgi:hypothetical protein